MQAWMRGVMGLKARWTGWTALVVAALVLPGVIVPALAQQSTFPATATIRGENIRLRIDATMNSEFVTILQRGDSVTITGDPVVADGEEFYPVTSQVTGDSGWVRALFINPDSIVTVATNTAPADNESADNADQASEPPADSGGQSADTAEDRQARRARRQAEAAAAETADAATEVQQADTAATPEALPTVEETPPPTAAETPPPTAAVTAMGEGATTSEPIMLEAGSYRVLVSIQVSAATDFTARLLGPEESTMRLFKETIDSPQSWTAETEIDIATGGEYTVKVIGTEDPWTIAFEPA